MVAVDLEQVSVHLDGERVLHEITLKVAQGEMVAVVGPSGSGKTTILRVVAGLTPVYTGTVRFDGTDVTGEQPAVRNVGMVFQEPALFPHRNVRRNVSFPLEVRHQHADEIRRRVDAEVRALHIETLLRRRPSTLSRGEEQLVQIARAMVRTPSVLLLDEPFSNLDAELQHRMRAEMGLLQRGYGVTTLMTTNDPADVVSLPDRLAVIDHGRVAQVGTRAEVHRDPATLNAAMSTGVLSTVPATVEATAGAYDLVRRDGLQETLRLPVGAPGFADRVGQEVVVGIRPEDLAVGGGPIRSRVERVVPGSRTTAWCDVGGRVVTVVDPPAGVQAGDRLDLRPERWSVFDPTSGYAIK